MAREGKAHAAQSGNPFVPQWKCTSLGSVAVKEVRQQEFQTGRQARGASDDGVAVRYSPKTKFVEQMLMLATTLQKRRHADF